LLKYENKNTKEIHLISVSLEKTTTFWLMRDEDIPPPP
jgi:hypothetical protein